VSSAGRFFRITISAALAGVGLSFAGWPDARGLNAQGTYASGQNIAVAYEGWEENADGTFNLVFGYFNRNWDEELDVPVGSNNNVEPGGPDQGQPTHFLPRRNRFVFRIKVPKDFGKKEVVWTLTSHGKTERAYATLRPEYITDPQLQQFDVGDFGHDSRRERLNKAPEVRIDGDIRRTATVGEPLSLTAIATDDGIPKARRAPMGSPNVPPGRQPSLGLRVAWFVYRGPATDVSFNPAQAKVYPDYRPNTNSWWTPGWMPPPLPPDGKFPVTVTFRSPGTYVIRVMAHDGGLQNTQDVTVTVNPARRSASAQP
jgi:hypothetical protein